MMTPPPTHTHTHTQTQKKYPRFPQTPKNIHFSEHPKNIDIRSFEQNNGPSLPTYVCMNK